MALENRNVPTLTQKKQYSVLIRIESTIWWKMRRDFIIVKPRKQDTQKVAECLTIRKKREVW